MLLSACRRFQLDDERWRNWPFVSQLAQWLSGSLSELELPLAMIDGIHFRGRVMLVALGTDAKGNKHVLGLRDGSTEATRVVRSLLSDLVERWLDAAPRGCGSSTAARRCRRRTNTPPEHCSDQGQQLLDVDQLQLVMVEAGRGDSGRVIILLPAGQCDT
jgi:hypothetical protein